MAKEGHIKKQIIILGLAGYLFYAYGIYVIERIYNLLYFSYMAVFALSFFAVVYGAADIRGDVKQKVSIPKPIRLVSIVFLLLQPVVFYPLWASQLLPLMVSGQKIEFLYSVYILDFCFIMPVFIIIAVRSVKSEGLGLLMAPAMFVLGFTLLFPLGIAEALKPVYGQTVDMAGLGLSLVMSVLFLVLAVFYLSKLKKA